MDIDKIIVFFKSVGFPAGVAIWFLWKIQSFMEAISTNGSTQTELLRQLIELHK